MSPTVRGAQADDLAGMNTLGSLAYWYNIQYQ
jgi:hypothetical protein